MFMDTICELLRQDPDEKDFGFELDGYHFGFIAEEDDDPDSEWMGEFVVTLMEITPKKRKEPKIGVIGFYWMADDGTLVYGRPENNEEKLSDYALGIKRSLEVIMGVEPSA
jgi:hypothetical protein